MKHLRLFEGFSDEDYFRYVDNDEWWDNRDERIEMSSRTIDFISGLFSNWNLWIDDNLDMISVDNHNIREKNYDYMVKVYEVEDEYFYVEVVRYYPNGGTFTYCYKCDQLEGLERFLKSEHII